nr:glycosyltransferase [Salipiger sp. PrR002]
MGCGVMHWRKSPDKFIEIAECVSLTSELPCKFVWIGGGPDEDACRQMVRDKGLEHVVDFIGYQEDVAGVLEAADLFLLPSEEDPFPLVCLYAAANEIPVVCFEDAGGMPEFVARGCGLAVPFGDVQAMSQAVLDYMADSGRLAEHGAIGRKAVQAEFSVTATGPQILDVLRSAMGVDPHVSIVVPNYNYGAYLEQRLTSIYSQSFQDFEVILLDDASPDGSGAILEDWARRRPATRAILNTQNSGSPFAQWMKGMREARSELVWIAEADDYCEPDLLAALVPSMDDRNVFLAHAKSMPVNAEGTSLGDYDALYLNRIAEGRWRQSYVATDHLEVNAGLAVGNVIPNASAVMIRKFEPEPDFVDQVTSMRMCGDWYFYLRALRGGNIAFDARTLNYHRRHGNTVTHQTEGSLRYFEELADIRQYVDRTYRISEATQAQADAFTLQDLDRFGVEDAAQRDAVRQASGLTAGKEIPSLLMVASDLSPGGGQMFAIRLANAWAARGGRAVLLNVGYSATHEKVLSRINPSVVLIRENDPRLRNLAGLCAEYDIDIIHSSIWWADKYVRQHIESLPQMPWVTTMHGCHETLLENPGLDVDFSGDYAFMRDRMDCWVHIADKNMKVFQELGAPHHHKRIANGVPSPQVRAISRAELGLRDDSVLLCLVSRGIEEKGWFQAVEIARKLNEDGLNVELMLVGEGPAATEIRQQGLDFVHLYGHVDNVDELISVCDVGILPSTFIGESMPLVLLEMMALAKPIIATNVGEIPEMIGVGDGAAGIVVPNVDGSVDIPAYCDAIRRLIGSDVEFAAYSDSAKKRFDERYDIRKMIESYACIYEKCLSERKNAAM